jgi:hypothetical protein
MDLYETLRILRVAPVQLEAAPPRSPGSPGIRERTRPLRETVCRLRRALRVHADRRPGHGYRWLDRCMPCLVATMKRSDRVPAGLEEILAVLRDDAREAGARLSPVSPQIRGYSGVSWARTTKTALPKTPSTAPAASTSPPPAPPAPDRWTSATSAPPSTPEGFPEPTPKLGCAHS